MLRFVAALTAACALSACAPPLQGAFGTLRDALYTPRPTVSTSSADILARPYFQQRLQSPWGTALLVLGRTQGSQEFWATSSGQVLVVEHGLIRRTTGLPQTLEGTRFLGPDPFAAGLHTLPDGSHSRRELDWAPGYRYGIQVRSRFRRHGLEAVTLPRNLGSPRLLLRIDEELEASNARFSVTNRYWVDPDDGFIYKSRQYLAPHLPVTLTQLRPYRREPRP